nr:hypothetical protein [Hydrogenophaga sp.]
MLASDTQTTWMPRSRSRTTSGTKSASPEPMTIMAGAGCWQANSIASAASAMSVVFLLSDRFTNGRMAQVRSVSARPLRFSALP